MDVAELIKTTQHLKHYDQLGLQAGAFFDRETFGADKLVIGTDTLTLAQALASAHGNRADRDRAHRLPARAVIR